MGVEWEVETNGNFCRILLTWAGKHNGVVKNMRYFSTEGDKNSGSLVKMEKAEFGVDFLEGLINRYFKDHEVPEILRHKDNIVEYLQLKYEKEVAEHALRRKKKTDELQRKQEEELRALAAEAGELSTQKQKEEGQMAEETFEIKEDEQESPAKKAKNSDEEEGSDESSDDMFIEENDPN